MSSYNYGNISLNTGYSYDYNTPDIDLTNMMSQTISIGPYTSGAITGATGSVYTTTGLNGSTSWNIASNQPQVHLTKDGLNMGEECDVKIGDWSLREFAQKMEERLAILTPNPKLEAEWDELRELGDRYRELENEIKAKMKTWDILKKE